MGPSDSDLIARVIARDDRHAFAELVRRHQSSVRALLRRLACGDRARADDLAQESFLRAYRGLGSFRGGARFSSWLYRIAYNTFLSDLAGPGRALPLEATAPLPAGSSAMLRHDLDHALSTLAPAERLAVVLSYAVGASHEEIAAVLGCPLGTAKTHVLRGRERLRRHLDAWKEDARDTATNG